MGDLTKRATWPSDAASRRPQVGDVYPMTKSKTCDRHVIVLSCVTYLGIDYAVTVVVDDEGKVVDTGRRRIDRMDRRRKVGRLAESLRIVWRRDSGRPDVVPVEAPPPPVVEEPITRGYLPEALA